MDAFLSTLQSDHIRSFLLQSKKLLQLKWLLRQKKKELSIKHPSLFSQWGSLSKDVKTTNP